MVFGNVIDFRDEQLMNCPLCISVIPSGIEIDCNDNISGITIFSDNSKSKVRVSTSKNMKIETIYITINSKSTPLPKTINVNNECVYKGNVEGNKEIVQEVNLLLQTVVKKYMDLYIDLVLK